MSVIKIFKPQDKPFGPLSNNYFQNHNLSIEGYQYRTPSNFIYAQLLGGSWSTNKLLLSNSPDIYKLFNMYKNYLEDNWQFYCREILIKAIHDQCTQSPLYKKALLSTKNSTILYVDEENDVLGLTDKQGSNLVGRALENVRDAIKSEQNLFSVQQTQTKKQEDQFEAYKVFTYLQYYTKNLNKSLNQRYQDRHYLLDKSPSEILEILQTNPMPLSSSIFAYDNATAFGVALKQNTDLTFLFGAEDDYGTYKRMVDIINNKQLHILSKAIPYIVERKFIKSVMFENYEIIKDELLKYYTYRAIKDQDPKQKHTPLKPYAEGGDEEAWDVVLQKKKYNLKEYTNGRNLLWDAYQNWKKQIGKQEELEGLPPDFLEEVDKIISTKNLQYITEEDADKIIEFCETQINILFIQARQAAADVRDENAEDNDPEPIKIRARVDEKDTNPLKILSLQYKPSDPKNFFQYDGYIFPTLYHYVLTRLIEILKAGNFRLSYYEILNDEVKKALKQNPYKIEEYDVSSTFFLWPHRANERFKTIFLEYLLQKNVKLLVDILNIKFKHRMLQNLLLSTGNKTLVYADPNNAILGNADKGDMYNIVGFKIYVRIKGARGWDRTGVALMQLRDTIRRARKGNIYPRVSNDRFVDLLKDSPFLYTWLYMRIQDTCRVIYYIRHYLNIRKKKSEQINKDFILGVLYYMYQPCSVIFEMSEDVGFEVPDFVKGIILNQAGFNSKKLSEDEKEEIVSVIWTKISVMMYFFINQLGSQASDENITITLAQIQNLNSESGKCTPMVMEKDKENCIFLALTNLLFALNLIAEKNNVVAHYGILEIETIISILLCEDHFKDLHSIIVENEKENTEVAEIGGVHILGTEDKLQEVLNTDEDDIQEPLIPLAYTEESSLSHIADHLRERFQISWENAVELSKKIVPAIEVVHINKKLAPLIKQNRINFFSQINNLST